MCRGADADVTIVLLEPEIVSGLEKGIVVKVVRVGITEHGWGELAHVHDEEMVMVEVLKVV